MLSSAFRSVRIGAVALAVTAAGLAACSGNSNSTIVQPVACSAPGIELVYPAPSATGVPDTFGGIVLGSSSALPASAQAVVGQSGSSALVGLATVGAVPTPFPSPAATPSYANPAYAYSSAGNTTVSPGVQVSVYYNDTASNCTPLLLGSFTAK